MIHKKDLKELGLSDINGYFNFIVGVFEHGRDIEGLIASMSDPQKKDFCDYLNTVGLEPSEIDFIADITLKLIS